MFWLTFLKPRLEALSRKKHFEKEMDEELRFHLESMIQNNIQSGMTRDDARHAALLSFGGMDQIKESCRDTRWTRWLDQLWHDLRYVLRIMLRNPLSSIITVILIATTIGPLCAAYAVLDAVLLRTLPVPHPEQLVVINPTSAIDSSIYDVVQQERQNVSQIFGMKTSITYGNTGNATRPLSVCVIKGDYFGTIYATPQIGRFINADEEDTVAVISDPFWHREFGGSPDILGRSVKLGLSDFTIVGVARPDFILVEEPYSEWEVTVPYDAFSRSQGTEHWLSLQIIARLKEGRTAKEYEAQLNSLWPAMLQATVPPSMTLDQWRELSGPHAQVVSIPNGINYVLGLNQSIPLAIHIVFSLSILIFLSECLALILLAIARTVRNCRQAAILSAIGGGRWRVQRPFFLETLILAVLGCALGLVIALWWSKLGTTFLPNDEFINWHIRIDGRAITLAFLMMLFIIALLPIVTAVLGYRNSLIRVLQSGAPESRPSVHLRTTLLAIQLAISVLLVQYALFFTDGFSRLLRVPLGFDPGNLHVYTLLTKFPGRDTPANYVPRLISQIEQMAEVESAAITSGRPPADFPIEYKQPVKTDDGRETQATVVPVSPNYFRSLNLPMLLGRDFSWSDGNTVVVNETLLKKLYPDKDSLSHNKVYPIV
jgi:predicted permease